MIRTTRLRLIQTTLDRRQHLTTFSRRHKQHNPLSTHLETRTCLPNQLLSLILHPARRSPSNRQTNLLLPNPLENTPRNSSTPRTQPSGADTATRTKRSADARTFVNTSGKFTGTCRKNRSVRRRRYQVCSSVQVASDRISANSIWISTSHHVAADERHRVHPSVITGRQDTRQVPLLLLQEHPQPATQKSHRARRHQTITKDAQRPPRPAQKRRPAVDTSHLATIPGLTDT